MVKIDKTKVKQFVDSFFIGITTGFSVLKGHLRPKGFVKSTRVNSLWILTLLIRAKFWLIFHFFHLVFLFFLRYMY